jgi:hypothetical protein
VTKTEQIITAMKAVLAATGANVAGLSVRDDTDAPYSFEDYPVIVLDAGDEHPDPVSSIGFTYWNLAVQVIIAADGPEPKMAPEPAREAAHAALYADRTLGGVVIDLSAGPIHRSIDNDNPALGITQATYNLKYRTLEGEA